MPRRPSSSLPVALLAGLLAALLFTAAACGSDGAPRGGEAAPAAEGEPGDGLAEAAEGEDGGDDGAAGELVLGVGETARAAGLELTLVEVSRDSRCPAGVSCVWEGDAVATVRARAEGTDETFELHLSIEPRSTVAASRRVTFRALAPPAVEGESIPADAYRATFLVEPV